MGFEIRKAERKKAKLRLALCGVAGAGKTYSALLLASGLNGKICIIDTESKSADLYASEFEYDVIEMGVPFSPARYVEAIKTAEKNNYDIIIIDSLSHGWAGSGGALDMVQDASKADPRSNSYTAWGKVTPEHNKLLEAILTSKCHVIATMRSKAEYTLIQNEKGKLSPVKIGLAPIQREGMDFEFTVVLDISVEHYCSSSKDRTKLFDRKNFMITKQTGEDLLCWLNEGKDQDVENETLAIGIYDHYKELIEQAESEEIGKDFAREGWKNLNKFGKSAEVYQQKIKMLITEKYKTISTTN